MWTSLIFLPYFLALAVDRESQGTFMCIYLNEVFLFFRFEPLLLTYLK